ncbi:hypothetical protein GCM10022200_25630 [Microbacterium awajiense]|uniref:Uncharacterized protein n=1 Tax=Microbacterium awajiense TaxID=415214 RepID=A0ABP7AV00_9MICO
MEGRELSSQLNSAVSTTDDKHLRCRYLPWIEVLAAMDDDTWCGQTACPVRQTRMGGRSRGADHVSSLNISCRCGEEQGRTVPALLNCVGPNSPDNLHAEV